MAASSSYRGITVKFGADTTDLGTALKSIDTQAKSVSQDLKEIDKGLKLDPANIELTEKKFGKLTAGIELTKKRLDTLKEAQSSAENDLANGVPQAEERYKDLQREIEKTELSLAGLRKQAEDAEGAVKERLTHSVEEFAGQVKAAAATTAALVTALGGIAFTSAKTADDFNTLSKVTGISTEELQKFSYASSLIDVSVSTLQGSLQRLVRNMQNAKDGTGDAAEAFDALGINISDGSGKLRSNVDVFYDVIDALGQVENATERDAYAMNIFGRSAQELNPLILAGSQALRDYGEQAESMGMIFDQEMLDNLNEMNDKLDISKQQLKGASMIIGGELINSFDNLFGGADRLLKMVQQAKEDGTLAEIADAAASAVEGFVSVVSTGARFVYRFREEIAAGVGALIAYKSAVSISNIVLGTVNAVRAFTAAQEAAAAAQGAFNTAATANPYGLIAAAAALAAAGILKYVSAQREANSAYGEFFDKVSEEMEKNSEAVRSYDELKERIDRSREARQRTAADIEGEYYGYGKLIERLYELDAAEDKSRADREEMSEIVDKLQKGIDGLSISYNKETGELITQREELERAAAAARDYMLAKAAAANQEGIASDLAAAELDLNKLESEHEKAVEERRNAAVQLAKKWNIDEGLSVTEILHELIAEKEKGRIYGEDREGIDSDITQLQGLNINISELDRRLIDAQGTYDALNDELDSCIEQTGKYSERLQEEQKRRDAANESTEKAVEVSLNAAEAAEAQTKAYDEANSRAARYKSEVEGLINVYDRVNAGMRLTTGRINELIDKYPELVKHIKRTSDGYKIESEAIADLISEKSRLMLAEKEEAAELAKQAYDDAQRDYISERSRVSAAGVPDEYFAEQKKQVDDLKKVWEDAAATAEGYRLVVDEYSRNNYGWGDTDVSDSKADTTDYWKQAAESEVAEAEHLYKMGEIKAEEYYSRLEDINKRYYENRQEYINECRKLEETVYNGLKKQQEDRLSAAKTLLDRINAVSEAKRELEGAEKQQVSVYSAAAGFHAEQNTAAIDKASQALLSRQLELASLLQQKYSVDIKLTGLEGLDPMSLLPDLSGIKLPSASGRQQTVNVDYHAGNIYISGNADSDTVGKLKDMMNSEARRFFEEYLDEYLEQADRDRQTGG